MKKRFLPMAISIWGKIALVFLSLVLSLVLLEGGLRLGGFISSSMQARENLQSIKQKGTYRILCLGESTTQNAYPKPLERALNQGHIGVRFSVIDKGKTETNSIFILNRVESYLEEYRPDMVVAMMGVNDDKVIYYEDISESDAWLFRHCRVYKFFRILFMQFLKKLQKRDIYRLEGSGSSENAKPGDTRTGVKNEIFSNEIPAEEVTRADSTSEEGYLGSNDRLFIAERFAGKEATLESVRTVRAATSGMSAVPDINRSVRGKPELVASSAPSVRAGGSSYDDHDVRFGAHLYRVEGKLIEAEAYFRKVIELNPKNERAYVELGRLYRLQDKLSQAENVVQEAIRLNPENDKAYNELGWVYHGQGKISRSVDMFKKAIELDPKNDFNQATIGGVYRRQGNIPQAEDSFKKAIELNPANMFNLMELGALYREQGKFSAAEDLFKRALGNNVEGADEHIFRALASLYEEIGKPALAKEYTEKVSRLRVESCGSRTVDSYRKLKKILDKKRIKLVCVQYPMRSVKPLKEMFGEREGVIFVDNERLFKEEVKRSGYKEYFMDMFAGDFGHCTLKGNMLLAQNIADVILQKVFHRQ